MADKGFNSDVAQGLLSLRDVLLSAVSAESADSEAARLVLQPRTDFENVAFRRLIVCVNTVCLMDISRCIFQKRSILVS